MQPTHRQRAMVDEERQIWELDLQPTNYSDEIGKEMVSTDTEPAQPGHKVREEGRTNAPPEIPEEFKKWKPLFQEEEGFAALPRHQNHGITEYNFNPAKIHHGSHYTGYPKKRSKSNDDG
ncbi:hypothetical protein KC333_g9231 [Hortaea werneckii]|nr:hypothetical protein KC333_g9231 [Hortaea werneckii]